MLAVLHCFNALAMIRPVFAGKSSETCMWEIAVEEAGSEDFPRQ